jgi:hypothetical protein
MLSRIVFYIHFSPNYLFSNLFSSRCSCCLFWATHLSQSRWCICSYNSSQELKHEFVSNPLDFYLTKLFV